MSHDLVVRHFRQIVLWPLQLMPVHAGQIQRHWEVLEKLGPASPWREVADEFCAEPGAFQERHYKEFVTFLPYAQRFLYGSSVGQETSRHDGEPSLHVYRRHDIRQVRMVLESGQPAWTFAVAHVDLYFFLDADIVAVAFEMHVDDIPLDVAQDVLFRFGRAYPGFWHDSGDGGNCPHRVEWLDADGRVLSISDYANRAKYLDFVGRYRAPCIAEHWNFLLRPLVLEYPGQAGDLRYRQLEYYRMPLLAYLAVDDPRRLSRADWVRLGLVARPGGDELPFSERSLADFETEYCEDRYWNRDGGQSSGGTRILVTGQTLSMVGAHGDPFFSGAQTGLLSQFRHQFFLVFLVAHFHKAALLSMSDELAVALDRLRIGDTESTKAFKRTIRQVMEVFLRFSHRYWFREISAQDLAQRVFHRLRKHLDVESLHLEVRSEVMDMNDYLDSDSLRRQANTVLRLTVVTILALIGAIATGFLGMNLIDETEAPLWRRIVFFAVILAGTVALTAVTIARSKRLADFLDVLSDERIGWATKLRALRRVL